MKRSQVLLRNISSNFFTQFWLLPIGFFSTPFIFHKLGVNQYGLLVLLNTIPVYFSVLNLGIIPALIKNISELKVNNQNLDSILKTSFTVYFFLTIIWGLVIFLLSNLLTKTVLKIPIELKDIAIVSFKLLSLSFILSSLTNFFSAIPQALQRFEIFNLKNLIIGTFVPLGTILLLLFQKSIIEIIYLNIFINGLTLIIFYFIAQKLLPQSYFHFNINLTSLKKILSFGIFKFISNLNTRIVFQLNEFLIATFLPIGQVSFYSIPATLSEKVVNLLPNITTPIFPLASELHSLSLKDKLIQLYKQSVKLVNFLITPIIIFLFFFSYKFLSLWINQDFASQASIVLKIVSISYLLASFPAVPVIILEGMGKPKIPTIFSTISALMYLTFAFILIPKFGLMGAVLAVFFNRIIQVPVFIFFTTNKILKIKEFSFYTQNYLKFILIAIVSALFILPMANKLESLLTLILLALIYEIIYFIFCLISKTITKEDIKIIKDFLLKYFQKTE